MEIEYLTIEQAASFLDVAVGTMYRYASTNIIPSIQHGKRGKIYFRKSDIVGWLELAHNKSDNNGNNENNTTGQIKTISP